MFVSVKLNPGDARTYTYAYHGAEQIEPGDFVVVETRDGRKPVEVVAIDVAEPAFACKPIVSVLIEREV